MPRTDTPLDTPRPRANYTALTLEALCTGDIAQLEAAGHERLRLQGRSCPMPSAGAVMKPCVLLRPVLGPNLLGKSCGASDGRGR
jgi:hypothetical protein